MPRPSTRRRFLHSSALAGTVAIAGCLASATGSNNATDDSTPTGETTTSSSDVEEWLADANGYDGDIRRFGPHARPSIRVGEPVEDGFAFAPAAIEVPPMTTVHWDWTGHGGQHNVVALDGTFDSGRTNSTHGLRYYYVLEETGIYRFVSEPHQDTGMKGVVIVKEPPETGIDPVDDWLQASSNFEGTIAQRTGVDSTTVTVGAVGNGGHFAFDPPALRVSTGTTVRWRWSKHGSPHNVVFEDTKLSSGPIRTKSGVGFEHEFTSTGIYRYACDPHKSLGMRGVVIVE